MNIGKSTLKVYHKLSDCLYWSVFAAIFLFTAFMAIIRYSFMWALAYVLFFLFFTLMVNYRFFCTHCPHYIRKSPTLKCMFFWGMPKYFQSRPGPFSLFEMAVGLLGFLILILFPVYWLWKQPSLFFIYCVTIGVWAATIKRYECGRCIHFHCPNNNVPEDTKDQGVV